MSRFNELSRCKIENERNLVISEFDGKVSIAQQLDVENAGRRMEIFLKNSISTDLDGLKRIKQAIDKAIEKLSSK